MAEPWSAKTETIGQLVALALFAALLVVGPVLSQNAPPNIPEASQPTANPHQSATGDQGVAGSGPILVELIETENYQRRLQQEAAERHSKHLVDTGILVATGIIAVFTIILAIATLRLNSSTRNLVVGAEETAARQLRAYVTLDLKPRPYPPEAPDRHDIRLRIVNQGQTWARDVRVEKHVVHLRKGSTRDPFEAANWTKDDVAATVLGPRQRISAQFEVITTDHAKTLATSQDVVYLVARVRYRDAIDGSKVWETQLSRRLNTDARGDISFSHMPTHNCADEDCPPEKGAARPA